MLLYKQIKSLSPSFIKNKLKEFLKEDMPQKDYTSECFILKNHKGSYNLKSRETMVFCGQDVIKNIFSKSIQITMHSQDGAHIKPNQKIATLKGGSQEILIKERVLLNLIQRLSGIASMTNEYIKALNNPQIKILDTRKTTPGLRQFEKYAVQVGGGSNHRMDLSSGVMIKDNHIATSTIQDIVGRIKDKELNIPIQIEIDKISQITQSAITVAHGFLLDNMTPKEIQKCIEKITKLNTDNRKIFIEVSGGITLQTIKRYNINGVNGISIGALTHQAKSKDIGLDIK